jgi:hypothetical protein
MEQTMPPKRILPHLFALVAVLLVGVLPAAAQADAPARLRLGHFSPDLGAVDVYLNGDLALEDFAFPDLGGWLEFEETTVEITITASGQPLENPVINSREINLISGSWYTAALIGEMRRNAVQIHLLTEDYSPIAPGETRVTLFNAIPDGQPINLAAGSNQVVIGLAYPGRQGDNDGSRTVDIVAQEYNLLVTETTDTSRMIFQSQSVLGRNRHYFIAAIGYDISANGILVSTNLSDFMQPSPTETIDIGEGSAQLRVGHFAPDAQPIDMYLNGELAEVQGVEYVGLSNWLKLSAGVYQVAFTPAGAPLEDGALVGPFDAALVADTWNTVAIIGFEGDNSLIGRLITEDYTPIPRGESRLTFFHAVPDAPPIDVVINDQVFVGALTFPGRLPTSENGTGIVTIAAGRYDIEITDAGSINNSYIALFDTQLAPGNHYFVAAINTLNSIDYYLQAVTQENVVERTRERGRPPTGTAFCEEISTNFKHLQLASLNEFAI